MKNFRRPKLEALENRVCPALTIRSVGPDLFITGTPVATNAQTFCIMQPSANSFKLMDGTKNLGTYPVSRLLSVKIAHYDSNIQIDLNNKAYTGSVTLDLGLGDRNLNTPNTVSVTDTTGSTGAGTIGGNLTILNGSGSEDIQIGPQGNATNMVVGGNVTLAGRNNFSSDNDLLVIGTGMTIGGALSTSFIDIVQVGENAISGITTVGSINYTNKGARNRGELTLYSIVRGNVSMIGTDLNDQFNHDINTSNQNGIIRGNLILNLGKSNDVGGSGQTVVLIPGTVVDGYTTLNSLGGANTLESEYSFQGLNRGNITVSMGEGANTFSLLGTVDGSVSITGGNGANTLRFFDGSSVAGNISVSLGNGSNSTQLSIAPQGRFIYRGGNSSQPASNEIILDSISPVTYNVDILFGLSGNHTLELNSTNSVITGRARSESISTSDFVITNGSVLPTFSVNF